MRPLRYSINISLDGCASHEVVPFAGDEDAQRAYLEELHRHHAANVGRADALLYGRVTYQMMEEAWREPADGVWPAWMEDWMIPFAQAIDAAPKHVVSSTLTEVDWNAQLVSGDLEAYVRELKAQPGERPAQARLAGGSPPHLADDPAVRARRVALGEGGLEPHPHGSLASLECDERAGIEHEGHRGPRTTVAAARSARRCRSTSAVVISPCSAS